MSNREKVINDLQMQIEELEERLAIVLEGQPEIVRCGDCKHMEDDGSISPLIWCSIHEFGRMSDYFCADAIRKEGR